MPETYEYGAGFIELSTTTQRAYTDRRTGDYVAAFGDGYYSVQLDTSWGEDKQQLAAKIVSDAERFELLKMDFEIVRTWFIEETGYAHMRYLTRLRFRDSGETVATACANIRRKPGPWLRLRADLSLWPAARPPAEEVPGAAVAVHRR